MQYWHIAFIVAALALAGAAFHSVYQVKKELVLTQKALVNSTRNLALCLGFTQTVMLLVDDALPEEKQVDWKEAYDQYNLHCQQIADALLQGASIGRQSNSSETVH